MFGFDPLTISQIRIKDGKIVSCHSEVMCCFELQDDNSSVIPSGLKPGEVKCPQLSFK